MDARSHGHLRAFKQSLSVGTSNNHFASPEEKACSETALTYSVLSEPHQPPNRVNGLTFEFGPSARYALEPMASQLLIPKVYLLFALVLLTLAACGGSGEAVVEVALHPTKPNILYIATNDYIFKTRDEGKTWKNVSKGMTHSRVISLAVDPLLPANVYAGTKGDAVFKSFSGGQQWRSRGTGLAGITITSVVHELKFVPGSSQHIFAATSMGVFETENGGETWIKRMEGMIEVLMVVTVDVDPNQPQTLYAGTTGGVYKSIDGSKTWIKVNSGLVPPDILKSSRALNVVKIKIDPHHPDTVYAATLKGLYKTTNGGNSWQRIAESLPDQFLSDLVLDSTHSDVLYVASREGIHKSRDGGTTWQAMNEGLTNLNIRALAISTKNPQTLYAGTNLEGLFRSKNGGQSWEPVPLKLSTPLA
jgi:photosystem II stability/assembly factor-like uncharacterized protein